MRPRLWGEEMSNRSKTTKIQTIVIGGGQAGLSVGYYLAERNLPFLILDANLRTGDAWRNRWDSLRLFSPSRYSSLPGMRFPGRGDAFPTKDQMADYLAEYAQRFRLPVRTGVKVDRLWKQNGLFVMSAGEERFEAENVIIAMANYQVPRTPAFSSQLSSDITQMHAHDYRNPAQLKEGGVLVVGVGNSGADIAIDVASTHPTWIAGRETGSIPWRIETVVARHLLIRVLRFVGQHVLTVRTRLGRKVRPRMLKQATPLIRVKPQDLLDAGIERVPRVVGIENGKPLLENKRTLEVKNVIWCTGYEHGFPWIDLPIFDEDGHEPLHQEGVVTEVPGMYFVGLHFLYAMTSATLAGISRDAKRIVNVVAARCRVDAHDPEVQIGAFEPYPRKDLEAAPQEARVA